MKIASKPNPSVAAPAAAAPKAAAAERQQLTALATKAAAQTLAVSAAAGQAPSLNSDHPLLKGFGEALGMGLGVVVTEALALVPSWNAPVLGADGKPAQSVAGATRVGDHNILKRHEEVVGPQVAALVAKMPAGAVHDLLAGLAAGATAAPGESYRLESAISDAFES